MKNFRAAVEARILAEREERMASVDVRRLVGSPSGGQRKTTHSAPEVIIRAQRAFRERQKAVRESMWSALQRRDFDEARRLEAETRGTTLSIVKARWARSTTEAWPL